MRRFIQSALTFAALLTSASSLAAETKAPPAFGPLLYADDFETKQPLKARYSVVKPSPENWPVVQGVLRGVHQGGHGVTIRRQITFDDIDISLNFRFAGGSSFNLVIDDMKEKSVHAGHICRVSVWKKNIRLADDKTGSMNQKIRKMRKDKNLPAAQKKQLEALLASKQANTKVALTEEQWYTLRVRIVGDVMTAYLDGQELISLQSPGFAHPTKSQFGFTVNGDAIEYDNLLVHAVK